MVKIFSGRQRPEKIFTMVFSCCRKHHGEPNFLSDMATETAMVNILLGHRRPEKIFTLVVSAAMSDEKFFTL